MLVIPVTMDNGVEVITRWTLCGAFTNPAQTSDLLEPMLSDFRGAYLRDPGGAELHASQSVTPTLQSISVTPSTSTLWVALNTQ